MKKLYLFIALSTVVIGSANAQFTNIWKKFSITPQDYTWFNNTSNDVSGMDYNPVTDKLLVSRRGSNVYIINPATGAEEGTLNTTGITDGFRFAKIRCTSDGVIYAVSMVTGAGNMNIWRWANQAAAPTQCATIAVTERCGDAFGLAGSGNNTVLYASGSGTTSNAFSVYIMNTVNGGINFFLESKLTMTSSPTVNLQWANRTVEPAAVGVNSDIWIKGGGFPAMRIALSAKDGGGIRTGTVVTTIVDGVGDGQASVGYGGMRYLTLGSGKKVLGFGGGNNSNAGVNMKMLDVTNEAAVTNYGTPNTGSDGLGSAYQTNGNGFGEIAYKAYNSSDPDTVFSLFTNNGLMASKSNFSLPVELTSFNATSKRDGAQLTWSTSTEVNNKGFDVERSLNGKEFSSIGFVRTKAEQGSTTTLNYDFFDSRAVKGTVYYRLKQIDNDGHYRYSSIEKISVANTQNFTVAPLGNPVKENIVLLVNTTVERTVQIQVSTANGAVIYSTQVKLQKGDANISIPVATAPVGVLHVTVSDNDSKQVIRIIKQ